MISLVTRPLTVLTWANLTTSLQTHPRAYWGSGANGSATLNRGRYALPMSMTTKQLRVNVVTNPIGTDAFAVFTILKNNASVKEIEIAGGTTGVFVEDTIVNWQKKNDIQFRVSLRPGPCIPGNPPICPILKAQETLPIFVAELDVIDANNF